MLLTKIKNKSISVLKMLLLGTTTFFAQTTDEEIKKEEVVVEFSFNPSLSEVFKLKTNPNNLQEFAKEKIEYQIQPKEIPSDFVPIPKRVVYVSIDKPKPVNYQNYVYGAFGLYGNAEVEAILRPATIKGYQYGIDFSSYNIQNGINDTRVNNGQWKTDVKFQLSKNNSPTAWNAFLDYQRNSIHWYGLDKDLPVVAYQNQDVQQVYNSLTIAGALNYNKAVIKKLTSKINFFSDAFNSSEATIQMAAFLNNTVFKKKIETVVNVAYVNGSFAQEYNQQIPINYSFFNLGIQPTYVYQSSNYQLKAAVDVRVNANLENSKSTFWLLPTLEANVGIIKNIMTLHGGVRSNFQQNNYAFLANQNSFISPTAAILASTTPLDFFIGLKGKLTKAISYTSETSYQNIKNKALFVHNNAKISSSQPFQLGNSFAVIYDDVEVFTVKGSVEMEFSKPLKGGVLATLNSYNSQNQAETWNLPNLLVETYVNYTKQKWFGQLAVNIVGARKDLIEGKTTKVNGYLDMNFQGGYKINSRLNAHANVYNLLNNSYELYANYHVQGLQLVAGISYKF